MSSIREQTLARLQSLADAGIDWLPKTALLEIQKHVAQPTHPTHQQPAQLQPDPDSTDPAPSATMVDSRRVALKLLADQVAACSLCVELFASRTQTVFGVGPLSPELCLIGEAPGFDEDQQGVPFVGKAGQLLNKIIKASGFEREEIYICNILKCRPPSNATPTPEQCGNCEPYLHQQIELVQPKLICCLGGTAAKNLLKTKTGITQLRGKLYEYKGIPVVCTYHPSALLRAEGTAEERIRKGECWDDFKLIVKQLGRELPGKA